MTDADDLRGTPRLPGYEAWLYHSPGPGNDFCFARPIGAPGPGPGPGLSRLIAVGGVSGKGPVVARLIARLEGGLERLADSGQGADPASVLDELNGAGPPDHHFATLLVAALDGARHVLTVANAGHPAPLLRHAGGRVTPLAEGRQGLPLWVAPDTRYEAESFALGHGEVVVLGTDGVTSVTNAREMLFSQAALNDAVARAPGGAAAVGQSILASVGRFRGGRPVTSDLLLLCFGRTS